jgi:hypothetical protein
MQYILPLLILILDIAMIVKIARSPERGKLWWILLILFLPVLGPLIYIGIQTKDEPLYGPPRRRSGPPLHAR